MYSSCPSPTCLKSWSTLFCTFYLPSSNLFKTEIVNRDATQVLLSGPHFPTILETMCLIICSRIFTGISIEVISSVSWSTSLLAPTSRPHFFFFFFMGPLLPPSTGAHVSLRDFTKISDRTCQASPVTSFRHPEPWLKDSELHSTSGFEEALETSQGKTLIRKVKKQGRRGHGSPGGARVGTKAVSGLRSSPGWEFLTACLVWGLETWLCGPAGSKGHSLG